jgi:DDE superfamily endonuclease
MTPCGRSQAILSRPRASTGIHWVCLLLLVPSPWGRREWALPFLAVPTRSPALSQKLGKPHRTIPQYAQVLVRLVRRWYPTRKLLLVGDSTFAAARLGHTCRERDVRLVSRLLLNAQLYDPVPPQPRGKPGVKPKKGPRQPKLSERRSDKATAWQTEVLPWYAGQSLTMDLTSGTALWHREGEAPLPICWVLLRDPSGKRRPCALFCTDPSAAMRQIVAWYISRWQIEVTFQEARCHLGLETQRQWSARAIARTTPCLLGLFSLVLLLAYRLSPEVLPTRHAAWYAKSAPTFADALAVVRRQLWTELNSPAPLQTAAMANPSALLLEMLIETACYAA